MSQTIGVTEVLKLSTTRQGDFEKPCRLLALFLLNAAVRAEVIMSISVIFA